MNIIQLMARPRKPRFVDGIQLVDNLFPDARKRPGKWRYRREDGSDKTFSAPNVSEANRLAAEANSARGKDIPIRERHIPTAEKLTYHVPLYVEYQEKLNPGLKSKRSWDNRKYALNQFAGLFTDIRDVNHDGIRAWWDELTYNQQKLRMAAFRSFFNWMMGKGLFPKLTFNPFTTADDKPRLLLKEKPKKSRRPITKPQYDQIYKQAGEMGLEALQIAMSISLYTTLRESDVCGLKWDDIRDGALHVTVSKSVAQKGTARATRHKWTLDQHPHLKKVIDRARELSMQHRRCPFIVSHKPRRRVWNEQKEHLYQVTADRLSRMFAEVRDACGIEGTAFHEIRGLSSTLYKKLGYTNEQIKDLMAHESVITTMGYQDAASLPHMEVALIFEDVK